VASTRGASPDGGDWICSESGAVEHAREDVAAELIGPEPVAGARRQQALVEPPAGLVRGQRRGQRRERDEERHDQASVMAARLLRMRGGRRSEPGRADRGARARSVVVDTGIEVGIRDVGEQVDQDEVVATISRAACTTG